MYSNLTLYYLNQMGIVPWVQRSHDDLTQQSASSYLLLIALSSALNTKTQKLFDQVLHYLAVAADDLTVLTLNHAEELSRHASDKKPMLILNLGLELSVSNDDSLIMSNPSLDYLLTHPAKKKQLFQQLGHIKQLLATKAH